jgi:uncharacterized protein involved in exopolysaccharide biosynthesis
MRGAQSPDTSQVRAALDLARQDEEISLGFLFKAAWMARKLIMACVTATLLLAVLYLEFLAHPMYTATAIIGPAAGESGGGAKQALASVAGIDLGGIGDRSADYTKFLEVLRSGRLAEKVEERGQVMRELFPGWDESTQSWRPSSGFFAAARRGIKSMLGLPGWVPPTPSSLARVLNRKITVERRSLITQNYVVSFTYKDRQFGLKVLNCVLEQADMIVREDKQINTSNRINYLKDFLNQTADVNLRTSFQPILVAQEQALMALQADRFYAMDLIDPPHADLAPVSPRLSIVFILALAAGLLISFMYIIMSVRVRLQRARAGLGPVFARPFPDPLKLAVHGVVRFIRHAAKSRHQVRSRENGVRR